MGCMKTVKYSFWKNGMEFVEVKLKRGIRQGDLISPYLYILCAEGFSSIMRRYEETELIHGCRVAGGALPISHLLFTDDCYLFFKPSMVEAKTMTDILKRYECISGHAIYYNKSSILFSSNTTPMTRKEICETLEVKEVNAPGKYLEVPMTMVRNKNLVFKSLTD